MGLVTLSEEGWKSPPAICGPGMEDKTLFVYYLNIKHVLVSLLMLKRDFMSEGERKTNSYFLKQAQLTEDGTYRCI